MRDRKQHNYEYVAIAIVVAMVHLFLYIGIGAFGIVAILTHIDGPSVPAPGVQPLGIVLQILSFPLASLVFYIWPGQLGWGALILFVANSACWGLAVSLLLRWYRSRADRVE